MSTVSTERLVELFEQELRARDTRHADGAGGQRKPRVSRELNQQITEYASEVRTSGSTPERMLVDLKTVLAHAASGVPSSDRSELLAELTGRAINAFFGRSETATTDRR